MFHHRVLCLRSPSAENRSGSALHGSLRVRALKQRSHWPRRGGFCASTARRNSPRGIVASNASRAVAELRATRWRHAAGPRPSTSDRAAPQSISPVFASLVASPSVALGTIRRSLTGSGSFRDHRLRARALRTPALPAASCWPAGSRRVRRCKQPLRQRTAPAAKSFHQHPSARRPSGSAPPGVLGSGLCPVPNGTSPETSEIPGNRACRSFFT